jgi:5-methyltetrahydrofolate--homocysteine methyltransferase
MGIPGGRRQRSDGGSDVASRGFNSIYKEDGAEAVTRLDAWWKREIVDRATLVVTAPRQGVSAEAYAALSSPGDIPPDELQAWFTNPEQVIPRQERRIEATYWGGEALPVMFPVSISMVAITAAYLGATYHLISGGNTAWADPVIDDWETRPQITFDPDNAWWQLSKRLLDAAGRRAAGRYAIGLPDLNGPSEILALLRGTEELALDMIDHPDAIITAQEEVDEAWMRCFEAATGVVHQWIGGYAFWMGIWSDRPAIDLQSDVSCLISPRMFERFFMPSLERQTEAIDRTIYHLDGPGAIRHLDLLLALPELDGIQWVPGAGAAPMSAWLPLLRRIQAHGKLLLLFCEPWEVEILLTGLEPEGLLLNTHCSSEEEARRLLENAARWSTERQWVVA